MALCPGLPGCSANANETDVVAYFSKNNMPVLVDLLYTNSLSVKFQIKFDEPVVELYQYTTENMNFSRQHLRQDRASLADNFQDDRDRS